MKEEELMHGGIESPRDDRDYKYSEIGKAGVPFDWEKGFDIEEKVGKLPVKDQAQTSACGGFAWATLSYVLDETNREEKSEKFIYAHTHVPGGGSYGRANCELCVTKGVASKKLCPLPDPLTEEEIIRTDNIPKEAFEDALTNKEKSYLSVNLDIESVAQALRDSNGVCLGITGKNNGTWLSAFPQKPNNNSSTWRHWVYVGKAKMIDGKKYIGFLNSWGEDVGEKGWQWISEDYFTDGYIWEARNMMYNKEIPHVFKEVLRLGSVGLAVKMLQIKLNTQGYNLKEDGKFGNLTRLAVVSFQRNHGLSQDGIVGPRTNAVLNSI